MNKKIMVGSIIAVGILVLVSFTGVVGYQTTKSSTIARASPLFNIRTNRAIDEESKDLTCEYIGKGNTLPFPERDDKAIMVQKVVDRISRMDDKSSERFIVNIIDHVRENKRFIGVNPDEIRVALYLLRDSDSPIPIQDVGTENKDYTPRSVVIACPKTFDCFTFDKGIAGLLMCIITLPINFIYTLIGIILDLLTPNCGGMSCTIPCSSKI
ncbi:MAG: hypothetical protein JSW06_00645 [Thermoplasmatales archaeon]|nr:MAG: hypothetical protein JSW06_00645 [Thermoplasmatales archaeon]